ncbi:MAG: energy-coupling factor ABC transporter ATP-binding protein [Treponema sp.]|nr:energy-coupling factor ABC transporter ATP-binding protein [Treponema sp.]
MSDNIITLKNVSYAYQGSETLALNDINVTIKKGEFILVMGANGAGKSTFCRLLNGLIPHSLSGKLQGTVEVDGIVTKESTAAQLSKIVGMAFDEVENQLFTANVFDEVAFGLENLLFAPNIIKEKTMSALKAVGMASYSGMNPNELSGGQKQRVVIAAALAMAGKVLVLDEPESQLDPAGAQEIFAYIGKMHAGSGLTIVMAVNACEDIIQYADRIIVLKEGKLEAFDTPLNVFKDRNLISSCGILMPQVCEFAFCMEDLGDPLPVFPLTLHDAELSVLQQVPRYASN